MIVSAELQKKVSKRVDECIAIAEKHFNQHIAKPSIRYDVRGRTGGYYMPGVHAVRFNPVLLNENVEHYIRTTVAHEVAHAIDYFLPSHSSFVRRRPHGESWKRIMRILGVPADRCHTYDTTNSQVRVKNKFEYRCKHCGTLITVGPAVHAKIRRGQVRWHSECGRTLGQLEYVRALGQKTYEEIHTQRKAAEVPKRVVETPKPKADSSSKYAKARNIVLDWSMHNTSAADMIRYIMEGCGMSKSGATTYYYKARKELGY